jgi:hypothetical protein
MMDDDERGATGGIVYCENHTEYTKTICGQMLRLNMLNQVVYTSIVTIRPLRVNIAVGNLPLVTIRPLRVNIAVGNLPLTSFMVG